MSYPDGTPRPDSDKLELAHDLAASAQRALSEALCDADDWLVYCERLHDEGIAFAQACNQARQEALNDLLAATKLLAEAGQ